jgi:hypothetical protein
MLSQCVAINVHFYYSKYVLKGTANIYTLFQCVTAHISIPTYTIYNKITSENVFIVFS